MTLHLVSSLIGHEQDKSIVERYDQIFFVSYIFKMSLSFASFGWIWKGCYWWKGWRRQKFGYPWYDN